MSLNRDYITKSEDGKELEPLEGVKAEKSQVNGVQNLSE